MKGFIDFVIICGVMLLALSCAQKKEDHSTTTKTIPIQTQHINNYGQPSLKQHLRYDFPQTTIPYVGPMTTMVIPTTIYIPTTIPNMTTITIMPPPTIPRLPAPPRFP